MSSIVQNPPKSKNEDGNKSFIVDSLKTEFKSTVRLAIAPLAALRTLSLAPIKDAVKSSMKESEKLVDRHSTIEPRS